MRNKHLAPTFCVKKGFESQNSEPLILLNGVIRTRCQIIELKTIGTYQATNQTEKAPFRFLRIGQPQTCFGRVAPVLM